VLTPDISLQYLAGSSTSASQVDLLWHTPFRYADLQGIVLAR